MALSQRLDLRQSQTLVMTPQLQQSIKLLQLNNLELSAFVAQELEQNPLLEPIADQDAVLDDDARAKHEREGADPVTSDVALTQSEDMPAGEALADIDLKPEDYWQETPESPGLSATSSSSGGQSISSGDELGVEQTPAPQGGLREYLHAQLGSVLNDPADRLIGAQLIELLDDAGYLVGSLDQVAADLGCPVERLDATRVRLQQLDPTGVFARSLGECLMLQLKERGKLDGAMATLLDNLEGVASGGIGALAEQCGVSDQTLASMLTEIRSLDPKPGLAFDNELPQTIVPDVFVRPTPDGGWAVELNTETLPRVMINARYYAELKGQLSERADKTFISDCFHNANWLVRSLDQRARTILKVSTELVRRQSGFLNHGIQHLRPLTLRDIADAIEMHESTVSRVSTNKYMATPRGMYELKFFFSSSLASTSGGEAHAAEAVRERIRELIDRESATAVLSDDRIADLLSESGVQIARRTVAKYREAMRIPSSMRRRRLKAGQAASA